MVWAGFQGKLVTTDAPLNLTAEEDAEAALLADWQALSYLALWELWDNDTDAVYDTLLEVTDDIPS